MSCSRSWTNESGTTRPDSSEDQTEIDSVNYSSEKTHDRKKINRELNKVCSEQIIVHRWFLSDIQSLNSEKEDFYVQSSSFGCTGGNASLNWIVRFYPRASKLSKNTHSFKVIDNYEYLTTTGNNSALNEVEKSNEIINETLLNSLQNMMSKKENKNSISYIESVNQLLSEILQKPISNIDQRIRPNEEDLNKVILTKETAHVSRLKHDMLKTLPQDSIVSSENETISDDKSYCALEILKVNDYEESPQALFETYYQIFDVADDGILTLLKTQGRYQAHFNRALIMLPRDTIFSISSNNILFSIKLIIYECSSTIGYCQSMSSNNKCIKNLLSEQALSLNTSIRDTNIFCNPNSMIELSNSNIFWLMSIHKLFTDMIIYSSDGQEFHAHRLILCTACEKLAEIISMNQEINKIEIDSISGTILKRILKYLYTGEIEISIGEFSIDEIRDLLNAVDFFELLQLKNIITKKCWNHITEKNCFGLLQLADDKQMKVLKNRILIFLCQQHPQLFDTDGWQQFVNIRPHLYDEAFVSLLRLNHLQKTIIENNSKNQKS
ncbi:unnamed protein product [Rotaria socialis]|uniref:BTB domain-containing protein n=1 Tax=Rotaria socialis TaxID=392032 RepID=A0A819YDW6_9BILA|nr:unnamed protein product [Rotaria socialis]CAF3313565.1 unnamed protein product [Rotaria socialis]CAF3467233.1 unnamed protein product [Rotaria socialis]CAF4151689.1 unnamed protein product [Rotaria socialis]CAF4274755.1 unnamed protein product [Rotaria socialis]